MSKQKYRCKDVSYCMMAELAHDLDSDLLELLCEDGFLDSSEVQQSSDAGSLITLLRLAFRRGFPVSWDIAAYVGMLREKILDILCVWNDIITADFRLRAPPVFA